MVMTIIHGDGELRLKAFQRQLLLAAAEAAAPATPGELTGEALGKNRKTHTARLCAMGLLMMTDSRECEDRVRRWYVVTPKGRALAARLRQQGAETVLA